MRTGHLIVIGGAEDKVRDRVILSRFVALAGGLLGVPGGVSAISDPGELEAPAG